MDRAVQRVGSLLLTFVLCSVVAGAPPAEFRGVGVLPGYTTSVANSVSADGSVVVGNSFADGSPIQPFYWMASGGIASLPTPAEGSSSYVWSTSGNGGVAVGNAQSITAVDNRTRLTQWPMSGAGQLVSELPAGAVAHAATDVSDDGQYIVGGTELASGGSTAFRWSAMGGFTLLGSLASTNGTSGATAISGDGTTIVGSSSFDNSPAQFFEAKQAFRWREGEGMIPLGELPGGYYLSRAEDVSADGSVVVGYSIVGPDFHNRAFRWTESGGMVPLDFLDGSIPSSQATSVSADGSVIVGATTSGAMIWDATHGMRHLSDVLMGYGADLTGWRLNAAFSVSADGRTIVGEGINPAGLAEGWVAVLPVPEPTSIVQCVGGLVIGTSLFARRRRKSVKR